MATWLSLVLSCLTASFVVSSAMYSDYNLPADMNNAYDSVLMQDLYKRLANIDPAYLLERDAEYAPIQDAYRQDWSSIDADSEVKSRPRSPVAGGMTDTRDSEYIGHSSNAGTDGFIYMSGGAGEGKQHLTPNGAQKNIHEVKSDETLPFYCHPPNPCPKGFTSEDGCQELIEDTAEMQKAWIEKMMEKGLCSCDEEHMFDCPDSANDGAADYSEAKTAEALEQQGFDKVLDRILGEKHESVDNPYVGGKKRQSLVAKKSPRIKRDLSDDRIENELSKLATSKRATNPYLSGDKLRTVAKKGHPGRMEE